MAPLRLCLLASTPFPPEEGIGYHLWNLSRVLLARGYEIGLITRGRARAVEPREVGGVTVWRVPFAPIYPLHVHLHSLFVNRLLREIGTRFDLINAHTPLPPAPAPGLPLVTSVHSPMRHDSAATRPVGARAVALRLQSPVSQRIERALFRRSGAITAVARWVADALAPYGVAPDGVHVTGNGVEPRFLAPPVARLSSGRPTILTVGRLDVGKGIEDLIDAARLVVDQVAAPPRFVLVGKGPRRAALEARVRDAGLTDHVAFVGHIGAARRDDLARLYREATLFVLPSHHEGMPTVLLEAMAGGLPVISTAVGGALEVIEPGRNGLLVAPAAPHELARAIRALLDDPATARRLAAGAHRTATDCFSWEAVATRYEKAYATALERAA